MHNGNLAQDSPGLSQNLKRYLKPEEVELVVLVYKLSCQYGALNEHGLKRGPGVSFNPRPARVAQILMTELRCCDPIVLGAAMLGCARNEELETLPEKFKILEEVYLGLRNVLSIPDTAPNSPQVESALFAVLLDRARHLHMAKLPVEEINDEISRIQSLLHFPEKSSENNRLKKIIKNSLNKVSNFLKYDR